MAFEKVLTDYNTWGFMNQRLKREPSDASEANNSYTDLLWELNLVTNTYVKGYGSGASGNYYVGLITTVPYVNKGHGKNEDPSMKGPWYVTYCASDPNEGSGKYGFQGHIDSPATAAITYYADRIVLKQELDYALDKNYVSKYQLGTYYTGVGLWWDSWNSISGGARNYRDLKEVPDGTYFTTTSYSEIFNDYAYNRATGNYAHAEGYHTYVVSSSNAHGEGNSTIITSSVNAHAEGLTTIVDNAHEAHVEGTSTKAFNSAYSSHAEGTGSYTKGVNAHAENSAYANALNSHAGGEATAGGVRSFAHGVKGTLASGTNAVALVSGTASGSNSVAIAGGVASSNYAVAIGEGAKANTSQDAIAINKGTSTGVDSFSSNTGKSSGTRSTAINNSTASGTDSFSSNASTASGTQSTALNASKAQSTNAFSANSATASKDRATALNSSSASGADSLSANASAASGTNSTSLNNGSATGELSLASGHGTASGKGSHAEGETTTASGTYSHAEGNHSSTVGNYAHAEGNYTKTTNDYEHAEGTFNQSYTGSTNQSASLFEIGDGTADNARHNVVSIFRNGNVLIDSKNNAYLAASSDISINGKKTVHITSPDIITTTDRNHLHSNNYVCIRGNVSTYLKGSITTYIGKDQEGNLTSNTYVVGNKKTEYISGNLEETTTGTTTTKRTGAVTITNSSTVNETTNGKITETFTKGRSTTITEGNSLTVNGLETERYNTERQSYVTGGSYMYFSEEVGAYIKGYSNRRVDGNDTNNIQGNKLSNVGGNNASYVIGHNWTQSGKNNVLQTIEGHNISYIGKTVGARLDNLSYFRSTYLIGNRFVLGTAGQTVNGPLSLGFGTANSVAGEGTASFGLLNQIGTDAIASFEFGKELRTYSSHNFVTGTYNKSYTGSYFELGIGTSETNRKNAITTNLHGVSYFHLQPYTYDSYINSVTIGAGKKYEPSVYPDESPLVSLSYYNLSYKGLYETVSRKFTTIGSLSSVKSIDSISKTATTNTLHYTKHNYNTASNQYDSNTYSITQDSATEDYAGLMSAEDKYRIDSIWNGDKTIALMNFDTTSCTWTIYKNDGTTSYTATMNGISNGSSWGKSSSNTTTSQSLSIEYGFKAKWTGKWKWLSGDSYKNAERCEGSISSTTLPAANTYSGLGASTVRDYSTRGTIMTQTIYAKKRGLIIDGYPDSAGATNNGSTHSGRIRPATGEDNRSLSVTLNYYYLFFYGAMSAVPGDMSGIKGLYIKNCTNKNVTCQYTTTTANPYFVFAYPAGFGNVSTIKKNGVEIITTSFLKVGSFNYVNGAGVTIPYNVYRTGAGVANMSITIS